MCQEPKDTNKKLYFNGPYLSMFQTNPFNKKYV